MHVFPTLHCQARRSEVVDWFLFRALVGAAICWTLCSDVTAAERQAPARPSGNQAQTGGGSLDGQPQAMNELRRQLLEHNRRWRAGTEQRLAPGVREAPGPRSGTLAQPPIEGQPGAGLLSQPLTGHWSDPVSSSLSRTAPGKPDTGLPSERITSPLTDVDSRLSERERSILRQQLRDSLRRQSGRENR